MGVLLGIWLLAAAALAQDITVSGRVVLTSSEGHSRTGHNEDVVVWLVPLGEPVSAPSPDRNAPRPRLVQKNKSFSPHLLLVPVGSMVEFPNRDPFFHNVFSLYEGKRFDLGLYEAGTSRDVLFDKPGVSYIFCNIHAEMSAVVIALPTPYYAVSNARGELVLPHVPAGRYMLRIWYEQALPEELNSMVRQIMVSESNSSLGVLRLATTTLSASHKNKYGRDYDPPAPDNPAYEHP